MNLIKKIRLSILPVMLVAVVFSCKDDSKAPVVTYDSAGKGAYIKSFNSSKTGSTLINILSQATFNASTYGFSVEFVDGSGGKRVTNYTITVEYKDVTGVNSKSPVTLRSYDAASFTAAESGNLGVANISITATDVTSALGVTYASLNAGDEFVLRGTLTTDDGGTWSSSNSSATVRGTAFQGFFDFTMPANCPSSLAQTLNYTGSNYWCDGGGATGTVNIVAKGGGSYGFSDWSFGAYQHCYGGSASSWGSLAFKEVCTVVSFSGFTDNYGDTWTFTSSIVGNDWLIDWVNTYGESGSVALNFPSGVPFTLN